LEVVLTCKKVSILTERFGVKGIKLGVGRPGLWSESVSKMHVLEMHFPTP
jgi:hypothetical protein